MKISFERKLAQFSPVFKTRRQRHARRRKLISFFFSVLTTSRSERAVDQGGSNESALFSVVLWFSPALSTTWRPHERSSLSKSSAGHACPRVFSVFLLSPAPFTLSPFFLPSRDLCPSALWSLFPSIHGVSHYTRGPQHTVPMATCSPAIYANLLSLPNLLPSPIYGNRFHLFNSFASADRVQPSRWWCWLFSRIESWESVRSKLTICNWSVDPQSR